MTQPDVACPGGGNQFNFLTWNFRGINNQVKRSKVLHCLHQLKAHIIFLQETHLNTQVGQVFHSSFQRKARGVAILVHKSVPFTCTNMIADPNGRYVIISGKLFTTNVLLVNIYAPNWDSGNFLKSFFSTVLPYVDSRWQL